MSDNNVQAEAIKVKEYKTYQERVVNGELNDALNEDTKAANKGDLMALLVIGVDLPSIRSGALDRYVSGIVELDSTFETNQFATGSRLEKEGEELSSKSIVTAEAFYDKVVVSIREAFTVLDTTISALCADYDNLYASDSMTEEAVTSLNNMVAVAHDNYIIALNDAEAEKIKQVNELQDGTNQEFQGFYAQYNESFAKQTEIYVEGFNSIIAGVPDELIPEGGFGFVVDKDTEQVD